MGFVYLILQVDVDGFETFKIGVSKNDPHLRVKQLSTGNPNQISLLYLYESEYYKKIENLLHRKYKAKQTLANNEWFVLDEIDVSSFIDECKRSDELIAFMSKNNHFYK